MKTLFFFLILLVTLTLTFCTTSKKATSGKVKDKPIPMYTYTKDIAPIMADRCAPCHFPGGKKKFLDTYAAVSTQIDDILYRIQLPVDSSAFMPFKSKKEPLNDSLVQVMITWKETGMPQ